MAYPSTKRGADSRTRADGSNAARSLWIVGAWCSDRSTSIRGSIQHVCGSTETTRDSTHDTTDDDSAPQRPSLGHKSALAQRHRGCVRRLMRDDRPLNGLRGEFGNGHEQ
jgi:hypothetical protein